MPTLRMRFPGGRYHATPWGHHVNEGLVEWPPCPWRLLRALAACGFATEQWTAIPPLAGELLQKLAARLPSYRLPPASAAHSRHFMPLGSLDKGRERTTLVFDTWADVGDGLLEVHWDCELTADEHALLQRLAAGLGYLGRSESWVVAELVADSTWSGELANAFPHQDGQHPGPRWEQVSLMAAVPAPQYAVWRQAATEQTLASMPLPEGNRRPSAKLLRDRERATAAYPADLLDCLLKDTAWWKQQGWSQPPGSQRVLYWRPGNALEVGPPLQMRLHGGQLVTTMLLALTTPSGRRSALPPLTRTLSQGELFHRAVVRRVAKGGRVHCPELTGKDKHGQPLRDFHRHAHILPVDLDNDGRLDHLIIHAPMHLGHAAQQAIRTMRRTWTKGGSDDLQLALAGSGNLDMLRGLPTQLKQRIEQLLGPPAGARVWVSATPLVLPRHLKPRGKNSLLGQVNAELASRGLAAAERVEILEERTKELRHYVRHRQHGGAPPPIGLGFALRLEFAEPICGPLTLGYASHFGLGMFYAVSE